MCAPVSAALSGTCCVLLYFLDVDVCVKRGQSERLSQIGLSVCNPCELEAQGLFVLARCSIH